ncbi:hypothetical protein MLP_03870 [Microlunatus phosphovorus NM-1]|uniref:Uncharacterized protein n=1 Tax=Microlunatus phosphovorus (strain ATCC 700054 / DSM 10555 / JCM 9379 / NBRC 101784 / NCIMB 13414 / VKM Ac-1990 / NM-1) TaxID=1032480 RepID=F5XJ75_MICPN|nr:hypothetical protein MLP_03870 [Microlunatus phosphovorus NM-1]
MVAVGGWPVRCRRHVRTRRRPRTDLRGGGPAPGDLHVHVDEEGVLRTDHDLRLHSASVVRLHYKLEQLS